MEKIKILIVEDDFNLSEELAHDLQAEGYEVLPLAASGEKALSIYQAYSPDCILMDIDLGIGKMDGIAIAKIINDLPNPVPIIMITGAARKNVPKERTEEIDCIMRWQVKPFNHLSISADIDMCIDDFAEKQAKRFIETPVKNLRLPSKTDIGHDVIKISDLIFVESLGDKNGQLLHIHTTHYCYEYYGMNLAKFMKKNGLEYHPDMIRVNVGVVFNRDFFMREERKQAVVRYYDKKNKTEETRFDIGEKYRENIEKAY
jgi:CheY-like chemotaxis protein